MVGVYSDLLFQMSLLDTNERNYFSTQTDKAIHYIHNEQYLEAFEVRQLLSDCVTRLLGGCEEINEFVKLYTHL